VDSTALGSQKLLSRVTRGFDITHSPRRDSETAVTGDAWIRQPTHLPRESETAVTCDAWILQPTQPSKDFEMVNELLSLVTRGFDSQEPSRDSEMINELLSLVTRGFDSPRES